MYTYGQKTLNLAGDDKADERTESHHQRTSELLKVYKEQKTDPLWFLSCDFGTDDGIIKKGLSEKITAKLAKSLDDRAISTKGPK